MSKLGAVLAVAAFAALVTGAAQPARLVVGGSPIGIRSAPWTVYVEEEDSEGKGICSGAIIDATHIVTADHCTFDGFGRRLGPSNITIEAGISNFAHPRPTDVEQHSSVAAIRRHPGFNPAADFSKDDVAVLELSTPLHLNGKTAKALRLPRAYRRPATTDPVGLAGFGRDRPDQFARGPLDWMTGTMSPRGSCPTFAGQLISGNAVLICVSPVGAALCSGDSGSALVNTRGRPTLVAVADAGNTDCDPGSDGIFADMSAPEILNFVRGDDSPPRAPHPNRSTSVRITWPGRLVVGKTVSCSTTGWSSQGRVSYMFLRNGTPFRHGPKHLVQLSQADAYARISCQIVIRNAGGITLAESRETAPVLEPG